ncbi:hypothetical protein IAU60_000251 [Kwoniella sp. DSM 27419]
MSTGKVTDGGGHSNFGSRRPEPSRSDTLRAMTSAMDATRDTDEAVVPLSSSPSSRSSARPYGPRPTIDPSDSVHSGSSETIYAPIPRHLALTSEAFSHLTIGSPSPGSSRFDSSRQADPGYSSQSSSQLPTPSPAPSQRVTSTAPSSTGVSDDERDVIDGSFSKRNLGIDAEQAETWLHIGEERRGGGKGKGRMLEGEGAAARLPPEILGQILRFLPDNKSLLAASRVSRSWCLSAFPLLWYKPHLPAVYNLIDMVHVLSSPRPSLPYAQSVRRINVPHLHQYMSDELLLGLSSCTRAERLTLTGAKRLSAEGLVAVLGEMPELISTDLSGIVQADDEVAVALAETCSKIQAINFSDCLLLGDLGVQAFAKHSSGLRRAKFAGCHRITERSLIPLIRSCPSLIELDFKDVIAVTDAVIYSLFLHTTYLYDLKLNGCTLLTENCIPDLFDLCSKGDDDIVRAAAWAGLRSDDLTHLRPQVDAFDCLRAVDFTGCTNIGDQAVENLINNAPKLRSLTLAKCSKLTDLALQSIGKLGKHLHHLHLGHCELITDEGVAKLAKACGRLRYIDLACCELLTDDSVKELSNMPKLRRVGLVKVVKITDDAIYALVSQHNLLERVHLSYCNNLTVKGVTFLLNRLVHLKHISLTGIDAFRKHEFQQFCRAPPSNFNEHQRATFCVFSGHKVDELRRYLNESYLTAGLDSDDTSYPRRGSGSSTSSVTLAGESTPPLPMSGGTGFRRGSAPVLRGDQGGIHTAFAAPTPNFLSPALTANVAPRAHWTNRTGRDGLGSGVSARSPIPEGPAGFSGLNSRTASGMSQDDQRRVARSERHERERERQRQGLSQGQGERDRPNGPRANIGLGIGTRDGPVGAASSSDPVEHPGGPAGTAIMPGAFASSGERHGQASSASQIHHRSSRQHPGAAGIGSSGQAAVDSVTEEGNNRRLRWMADMVGWREHRREQRDGH